MYNKTFIYSMGFALSVILANPLKAGEEFTPPDVDGAPTDRTGAGTHNKPIYHPPVVGAPKRIAGAGSRGAMIEEDSMVLTVLAPSHTGYTISEQPRLYWYISKKIEDPVTLTITYANSLAVDVSAEPILETSVEVSEEGVQVFDLSEYNVKFETGVEYEWSVSISPESEQVLREVPKINSVGIVKRISQSSELVNKVSTAEEKEAPIIYAQAGMWYDAISVLLNLIAKYPEDDNLQRQQISLLKEIGLAEKFVKKN